MIGDLICFALGLLRDVQRILSCLRDLTGIRQNAASHIFLCLQPLAVEFPCLAIQIWQTDLDPAIHIPASTARALRVAAEKWEADLDSAVEVTTGTARTLGVAVWWAVARTTTDLAWAAIVPAIAISRAVPRIHLQRAVPLIDVETGI